MKTTLLCNGDAGQANTAISIIEEIFLGIVGKCFSFFQDFQLGASGLKKKFWCYQNQMIIFSGFCFFRISPSPKYYISREIKK